MTFTPVLLGFFSIILYVQVRLIKKPFRFLLIDSFFIGLLIYFVGAVIAGIFVEPGHPSSEKIIWLSTISIISSTIFLTFFSPNNQIENDNSYSLLSSKNITLLTFFLVLFNISFSMTIYKNFFQGGFGFLAIIGNDSLMYARKMIASGESGYYAPGLVKLVRDILIPTFIFYLLAYFPNSKKKHVFFLALSTIIAILFGGRRNPLIALFFAIFIGSTIGKNNSNNKVGLVKIIIFSTLIFGFMTLINLLLGRSSQSIELSFIMNNFNLLNEILYRIFVEVPHSNILAYDFVIDQNFYFGEFWFNGIKTLLPGSQEAFSNTLHSFLGGSYAGNAVLGFPFSSYINSGFLGLILTPMVVMFFLNYVDSQCIKINKPFLWSIRMIMFVYIPLSYDPQIFLISGGIIFLFVFSFEKFKYDIKISTIKQKLNG